jgi:hypothetical protein
MKAHEKASHISLWRTTRCLRQKGRSGEITPVKKRYLHNFNVTFIKLQHGFGILSP